MSEYQTKSNIKEFMDNYLDTKLAEYGFTPVKCDTYHKDRGYWYWSYSAPNGNTYCLEFSALDILAHIKEEVVSPARVSEFLDARIAVLIKEVQDNDERKTSI